MITALDTESQPRYAVLSSELLVEGSIGFLSALPTLSWRAVKGLNYGTAHDRQTFSQSQAMG